MKIFLTIVYQILQDRYLHTKTYTNEYYKHSHTNKYTYIHTHTHTYTHTYIHTHTHTHTHTYINTYTHTHI